MWLEIGLSFLDILIFILQYPNNVHLFSVGHGNDNITLSQLDIQDIQGLDIVVTYSRRQNCMFSGTLSLR